jgi:hypothetical protein
MISIEWDRFGGPPILTWLQEIMPSDAGASSTSKERGATTTHFEHMIHCLKTFEDWMHQT